MLSSLPPSASGAPPDAGMAPESQDHLVRALAAGRVLCAPTESFVGLVALASHQVAIDALLAAKGHRDPSKGMPLIAAHLAQVEQHAQLPLWAARLAAAFWPGPLTLALPSRRAWPSGVAAADGTIGLRIPRHAALRQLAQAAGELLTVTSANVSGEPPVRELGQVRLASWAGIEPVAWPLQGEPGQRVLPSTVVSSVAGQPVIVREGAIARADIEQASGP